MGALGNVRRNCALQNAAGLASKFWIAKRNEVTAIAAATGNKISGATAFTMATTPAAGKWKVIEMTTVGSKKSYKSTKEGDADTVSIKTVVTGFIPGIEDTNELNQLNGCEWLVIALDSNGKKRLLGDLNEACTIKVEEDINENANGYPFEIMVERKNHFPYFLDDNVTITEAADA